MNLNGESFAGIEKLDEERKPGGGVREMAFTENLGTVVCPKSIEASSPLHGAVINDAFCLGAVDHFPEFANRSTFRDRFSKQGFKKTPPPDAFHGERFE